MEIEQPGYPIVIASDYNKLIDHCLYRAVSLQSIVGSIWKNKRFLKLVDIVQ